jgi:hypothetical protein
MIDCARRRSGEYFQNLGNVGLTRSAHAVSGPKCVVKKGRVPVTGLGRVGLDITMPAFLAEGAWDFSSIHQFASPSTDLFTHFSSSGRMYCGWTLRLILTRGGNRINPLTGTRLSPQFAAVAQKTYAGNSNFHALQVGLTRSFKHGFLWQTQYQMVEGDYGWVGGRG